MTCHVVYLYDKDNDSYSQGLVYSTEEQARLVAEALEPLLKQDMIVNRDNGKSEPYDWIEIVKYSNDNTISTGTRVAVYPQE